MDNCCYVGSVKDSVVGEGEIADYLLYTLNRRRNYSYVPVLGIGKPTDNLSVLLTLMCSKYKKDELSAARMFIRLYREGKFGLFLLDDLVYSVSENKQIPIHNISSKNYSFLLCFLA